MRIEHNHFRDIRRRHRNGGEAIQLGGNPMKWGRLRANAIVQSNLFERADGDDEVISNKSSGNTIQSNTFIGCGGALWLRGGEQCKVIGNYWNGGSSGIVAYGRNHQITANVITKTHSYALIVQYGSDWPNVEHAGLSFEALHQSHITNNAIVNPVVRGLVYGAFRIDRPGSEHLTVAPHSNQFNNNTLIGDKQQLLTGC